MSNHDIEQLYNDVLRTLRVADSAKSREGIGDAEPPRNPRRRDFGFGMLGLSLFTLIFTTLVPLEVRWMFGSSASVLLLVAAWEIDRPLREIRNQKRLQSKMKL